MQILFATTKQKVAWLLLAWLLCLAGTVVWPATGFAAEQAECAAKERVYIKVLAPDYAWVDQVVPIALCGEQQLLFSVQKLKPGLYQREVRSAIISNPNLYDLILSDYYTLLEGATKSAHLLTPPAIRLPSAFTAVATAVKTLAKRGVASLPLGLNVPLQVAAVTTPLYQNWEQLLQELRRESLTLAHQQESVGTLSLPMIKGVAVAEILRGLTIGFGGEFATSSGEIAYQSLTPAITELLELRKVSWPATISSTGKDSMQWLLQNRVRRAWALQTDIREVIQAYEATQQAWQYAPLPRHHNQKTMATYQLWLYTIPGNSRLASDDYAALAADIANRASALGEFLLPVYYGSLAQLPEAAQQAYASVATGAKSVSLHRHYRQIYRRVIGVYMEQILDHPQDLARWLGQANDDAKQLLRQINSIN